MVCRRAAIRLDRRPWWVRGRVSGTPQEWTIVWDVAGPGKDYTHWCEIEIA